MSIAISDGVSKFWVMRHADGTMHIDGFVDEFGVLEHVIRRLVTYGDENTKKKIQNVVDDALKHMDEDDSVPESDNEPVEFEDEEDS